MADNTLWGIVAIVGIVLVAAVFFSGPRFGPAQTVGGQAIAFSTEPVPMPAVCEESRYCEGSKLVLIKDDCRLYTAYCQHGCRNSRCL